MIIALIGIIIGLIVTYILEKNDKLLICNLFEKIITYFGISLIFGFLIWCVIRISTFIFLDNITIIEPTDNDLVVKIIDRPKSDFLYDQFGKNKSNLILIGTCQIIK